MFAISMKTVFTRTLKASLFILVLHVVMGLALLAQATGNLFLPARAPQPQVPPTLLQLTSGGHALGFATGGMYAADPSHALHVDFAGANPVRPEAASSVSSQAGASALSRVTYTGLWDGISLTYTSAGDSIYRTTWTLAPGADASKIRLRYNAPLSINDNGSLGIAFQTGMLAESAPIAWQDIRGRRVPVAVSFRLNGQELGFFLGAYDPHYSLTIDPTLTWNTFLGGSGADSANAIALDANGNIYIAGSSQDSWGTPLRPYTGSLDGFVAKLDPSGHLIWNTFLGGTHNDSLNCIALDVAGDIFVTGDTGGTWGNPLRAFTGAWDTLAARLDSSGNLVWNTFLGGSGNDNPGGIALDGNANVYISGQSTAAWGNPVSAYTGGDDAFAVRLGPDGNLAWSTFLGGSGDDDMGGIALAANGNVVITGASDHTWGSPVRAYSSGFDAFVARLNSSGNLVWNTFLGGSDYDEAVGIQLASGNIYVVGSSAAKWGNPVRAYRSGFDAFVARLDSAGNLAWNTFLGGIADDYANSLALDANERLYVVGYSNAAWGKPSRAFAGSCDALVAGLNADGSLSWNTFLGGSGEDFARGILPTATGGLFVTGNSESAWGSPVQAYSGSFDGFVARLDSPVHFASIAVEDGWMLESSETSGEGGTKNSAGSNFILGDDGSNRQYRSTLSFDTGALPDGAIITSARLRIRKAGMAGTNPFTTHGSLVVDIRNGALSANPALQLSDFRAAASKNAVATFSKTPLKSWYTATLPGTAYAYINTTGLTQLRLRFKLDDNNDFGADYIKFYSGNASAAYRPQLIIEYYDP